MLQNVRITIIGAGKVAWRLAYGIKDILKVQQVYNRTRAEAVEIARMLGCEATADYKSILEPDFLLLAISDDASGEVSSTLASAGHDKALMAHTSGIQGMEAISDMVERKAVFYPLNSFTKGLPVKLNKTPFFIDASNKEDLDFLFQLGKSISRAVFRRNEQEMPWLHLAAVFANNFSNHMLVLARKILVDKDIEFEKLIPLINQTFRKIKYFDPDVAQTGPAVRGDEETQQTHLDMIDDEEMKRLYKIISSSIQSRHQKS